MAYPLLTYSVGENVLQKELQSDSSQTLVNVESLDSEKLAEFLETELKDGGCAAIILNTVRRVQETAQFLKKQNFQTKKFLSTIRAIFTQIEWKGKRSF